MSRSLLRSSLLLCVAAVVLAAAGSAQAATYVPLNISGGFNMNAMIGPVVASQATLAGVNANVWLGGEKQGFTNLFPGSDQNELVCDSSSNDGMSGTTYKYFCTGYGGFSGTGTLTGSQGLPENGLVNSAVDSRTYLIASVSGNALLPGDWTEPPYLGVNPNTYTASNNKFNAIWVGQTGNSYGNAYTPFVTASFQPGYYSDLNMLLAGEYETTKGCAYTQIWATYADVVNGSNSLKLYDWGSYTDSRNSYPIITQSVAPANFKLAYTVGSAGRNGSGSKSVQVAWGTTFKEYLWEFTTPLTIDPARVLVSITVSTTRGGGNNDNAVTVYGATSTASATASNTLTVQQNTGGFVTTSQSGITTILAGYPYGAQVALTATATGGYSFSSWNAPTPAGHGTITGTGSQAVLTIYGSCTVSANFSSGSSFNGSEIVTSMGGAGGNVSVSNSGPYTMNQQFTATETPSAGWVFAGWMITGPSTLSSSTATTPTITVKGNFTLTAFFQLQTVPLDLSSGFNMTCWVGPLMFDYCVAQNHQVQVLYPPGPGGLSDICTLAADDPSPLPSYNGTSFTGTTCTPSDGVITGADRKYYIASVGGNSMLPGDWTETSTSGIMLNSIVLGQYGVFNQYSWTVPAVTVPTLPGHYTNVNFVLAAGQTYGANQMQIIAYYNDSTSAVIYDFGTYTGTNYFVGPNMSSSVAVPGFRIAYTAGDDFNSGTGACGAVRAGPRYLWEFSSPLTLDSSKILVSLTFSNYSSASKYGGLGIFGATAAVAPAVGGLTLTTSVSPVGAGTVTPATGTVPGNYTFPVTATTTNSNTWVFDHWEMSDPNAVMGGPYALGNPTATNSLTPSVANSLTVNTGNCTLTAFFRSTTGYIDTDINIGGKITLNPNDPYTYGQTVGITASAYWGWYFINWTATNADVWNETSSSTSITVYDSFDLAAIFSEIPYSVTVSSAPEGAGAIYYDPWEPVYITDSVVNILAVPELGWSFVGWTVTGANLTGGNVATSTISVMNNVWLTASFSHTKYTITVQQPGGGTISLAPSQSTYFYSNTLTITAAATGGYTFANWVLTGPGQIASYTSSKTTLTVQGNVTLTALLGNTTCTLTVNSQNGLGYTVSPAGPYNFGQVVTVTATSLNAGYVLQNWAITGGTGYFLSSSGALATQLVMDGNCTLSGVYTTGSYVNNLSPTASDSNVGSIQSPLMTIGKAAGKVKNGVSSTIVVCQGVYREAPALSTSGTPANPFILKSNPGDRVIVTGADLIPMTGSTWTQCTSATASGNTSYANIYYTDITWKPTTLTEDQTVLALSQWPAAGTWQSTPVGTVPGGTFYPITAGGTTSISDSIHLAQFTDSTYFNGAGFLVSRMADASQVMSSTCSFNPGTCTLTGNATVNAVLQSQATGGDFYAIFNHVRIISGPGQWAYQTVSANYYRVFVWPAGGDRPDGHLFEGNRLINQELAPNSYWIVDGLEVCGNQSQGFGGMGGACGYANVQNCVIHDNDLNGINSRANTYGVYQHNLVSRNGIDNPYVLAGGNGGVGICTGAATDTLGDAQCIFENDISNNGDDNTYIGTASHVIVGNFMHGTHFYGHSDNIQFAAGPRNWNETVSNNVLFDSNDATQANSTNGMLYQNNTSVGDGFPIQGEYYNGGAPGSPATSNPPGLVLDHNTFFFFSAGDIGNFTNCVYSVSLTNNLMDVGLYGGQVTSCFGPGFGYYSDFNLIYFASDTASTVNVVNWNNNGTLTWPAYQQTSSQDANSIVFQNPLFTNAPTYYLTGGWGRYDSLSGSLIYLANVTELPNVNVGDSIEISCDGVLRTTTSICRIAGHEFIAFTPSDARFMTVDTNLGILVWGNNPSTTRSMDLTLLPNSPGRCASMDGTDIGSNLNIQAMMNGQLDSWNGNYSRVIPVWPPTPVTLAASGWKYKNGGTAYALTEGNTYTNPNMTGFQITFGAPLYAACCTDSLAVTVVDNTGTKYPINAATLDSTGTVLTIVLTNGALPRTASWIEVILDPTIMGANGNVPTVAGNGAPVTGVKSVRFTIN